MASGNQGQIDALEVTVQRGFDEIKTLLREMDTRVRTIETSQAGSYPLLSSQISAAWRELETLKSKGEERQKCITDLEHKVGTMQKTLTWLGITFGGMIATLLWQIFTGQIVLVR
jgi:hypothetical protein